MRHVDTWRSGLIVGKRSWTLTVINLSAAARWAVFSKLSVNETRSAIYSAFIIFAQITVKVTMWRLDWSFPKVFFVASRGVHGVLRLLAKRTRAFLSLKGLISGRYLRLRMIMQKCLFMFDIHEWLIGNFYKHHLLFLRRWKNIMNNLISTIISIRKKIQ